MPSHPPVDLDAVTAAWRSRQAVDGRAHLDDRTWADLTLDEVFLAINRTASTLGQAALYYRLRSAPLANHLDAFDALVQRLANDDGARARVRRALARLQDTHGYDVWWLARPGAVHAPAWYIVFPLLTAASLVLGGLAAVWHSLLSAAIIAIGINLLVRVVVASDIVDLRRVVRQLAPVIATGERLAFVDDAAHAGITGRLAEDAARLRRLKVVARWASEDPLMLSSAAGAHAWVLTQFLNAVYEYVNALLLLDGSAIYFARRDMEALGATFVRLAGAAGDVDAALSVAEWRAGRQDWSVPAFSQGPGIATMTALRHPLIDGAVPNDVTLTPGRGIVITGSNMSGKSTFLRTVGVNIVLAQTIHTCLASSYRAPVIAVASCIGRSDDLLAGKSYYLVEVEQVVARLQASGSPAPHLFIFDELFRGTNAVERIAAGEAVLRELVAASPDVKPHYVLAATHDAELVGMLTGLYEPFHFTDTTTDEGLTFDYRLEPGVATTRNAIALLAMRGAPARLIDRALASATNIERQRGL